jgi:putative SOS response-associated peptidase YedK
VLLNSSAQRELVAARWWMILENWQLSFAQLPTTFNARAEELGKRFWSRSFNARRAAAAANSWVNRQAPDGPGLLLLVAVFRVRPFVWWRKPARPRWMHTRRLNSARRHRHGRR